MAAFSKATGIYSAKLGLYMYAVALQMIIGYFMILCSPNKLNIGGLVRARSVEDIQNVGFDVIQGAGVVHILFAVLTFALLILAHFVTSCFKIPMLIVTIVQTAYCSFTAGVCALYLQRGYDNITQTIQLLAKQAIGTVVPSLNQLLVDNRNMLYGIGILAVIATSFLQKAQVVKGTDSSTQVMVVIPCVSLGLGIAFALTAPCRDYRTFTLGFFWALACIIGDVISSVSRFFCFKPFKLFMLAVYAGICLLSVITIGVCSKIYSNGKIDLSGYLDVVHGTIKAAADKASEQIKYDDVDRYIGKITTRYTDEELNVFMGNGIFLLVVVMLSIVCLLFGVLALFYSIFRFFDRSRDSDEANVGSDKAVKVVVS
ncbi:putative integral membrane protein [Babesia bovis T2Bo]|uniref:Membrane protein, putative n=1 Tax=Babesia bovis TaxID=5865 RepID=A7APP2_BABBO|nr:putative integral membrane protein [Babesia bovis T2Bo]EDO08526.1 putative integral membrane protein [Babesia bovis T2Bo]|eukprot:XP_001612094.1 membrane protein [Babesia bovis T2Bo]